MENLLTESSLPNAGPSLPDSPVKPVVDMVHGVEVSDPYRWLEAGESEEVQEWTAAQNAYTRRQLDGRPERTPIHHRLAQLMQTGYVMAPVRRGQRIFYTSRTGDANQAMLFVRDGDQDRVLVDPAGLRADATVALDWWHPSPDGALLAYGLSEGGNELSMLHVMDVATGALLADRIDRTRYCGLAWLPDASGFYYTRYPTPGSVPANEEQYHRHVFLHHLGDEPTSDALIYADADPQAMPSPSLSKDGRYLLIECAHGWSKIILLWRDLQAPGTDFTTLNEGLEAIFSCLLHDDHFYIHTNWQAPRFRVLKASISNPFRQQWQEIIPEGPHPLDHLSIAGDHLVGGTLEQAIAHLYHYSSAGARLAEIPLPAPGTVYGPTSNHDGEEVFFTFTSFAYPPTAYQYDPRTAQLSVFKAPLTPPGIDPATMISRQVWYPSKDGTLISMFLVHRSDTPIDGQRPTVLTGYGGFNVSRTAEYGSGAVHVLLEQGGVWALANLRGGGEYGESWHEAGMQGNKQNVFDDFIAAGDWLVANGYTNAAKLACWGGSNGGLLVGAAIVQRPDLFQAAVCAVPLLDMVRYHLFRIARLWIPEYGSSEDRQAFQWLYAYSPYHHVRPGLNYPATLLLTAEEDSRVDPLHARKMAALLQAQSTGRRPILLRVEERAGHGAGKPVSKLLAESADTWTFLFWQLGLHIDAPTTE